MSDSIPIDADAPSPPPAPPLPPQLYGRATDALVRFAQPFFRPWRSGVADTHSREYRPSGLGDRRNSRSDSSSVPFIQALFKPSFKAPEVPQESQKFPADNAASPPASRSTAHKTGIHIEALDISPARTHAILAGRSILKTVRVSDGACHEDFNLRDAIIAYAATHETADGTLSAKHSDQLAASDVKWSHGSFDTTIATAAANGQIVVYDINRPGVELARLHEHNRQVHRLGYNPHQGSLMLSGSQDSTVRLWDLRALAGERSVMTCQSKETFLCNSEGVRDLRWSPTNGVEFAVGTDNGVVQRWDMRKEKVPLLRIGSAHERTCNSVDWHPDGKHLASGGVDGKIKVWDFSSSDRRTKCLWQIQAPQAVLNARWRPACWSTDSQSLGVWQSTQLATTYDIQDPSIHIWDFRRPSVPFRVLDRYDTSATALLWHSKDLLWSAGSAGMFTQTDIKFARKTMDRRSYNSFDIAPDGQILFFSQRREQRRMSIENVTEKILQQYSSRASTEERLSGSHSATEGSLEEPGLLSSSFKKRRNKAPASLKSTRSATGTPPLAGLSGPVLRLERSLHDQYLYKPTQVAGLGYIEGLLGADAFKFMARHYKAPPALPAGEMGYNLHFVFRNTFRANAAVATFAGCHRLAQSWVVLAHAVELEFEKRAEDNRRERRSTIPDTESNDLPSLQSAKIAVSVIPKSRPLVDDTTENGKPSSQMLPSKALEVSPRLATPLVRPISDSAVELRHFAEKTALGSAKPLQLPDLAWGKQGFKSSAGLSGLSKITSPKLSDVRRDEGKEHTEQVVISPIDDPESPPRADFTPSKTALVDIERDIAERRAAAGNYRAMPRNLVKLGEPIQTIGSGSNNPNLGRHDSDESFQQMFSVSANSTHLAKSTLGSFESSQESGVSGSTPEEMDPVIKRPLRNYDRGNVGQAEQAVAFDEEDAFSPPSRPTEKPLATKVLEEAEVLDKAETPKGVKVQHVATVPTKLGLPIINSSDIEQPSNATPPQPSPPTSAPSFIESDFSPSPPRNAPPPLPWTATALVPPLLYFHISSLHDTQLPAYLLLHLAPYLNLSLPPHLAQNTLLTYHVQLQTHSLHIQAAELRNHCAVDYPAIADYGLDDTQVGGAWCVTCQKPNKGTQHGFCERCKQPWSPCPVCEGYGPLSPPRQTDITTVASPAVKFPQAADALWGWCQNCGHGGHNGCLATWWDFPNSLGGCPTQGCMCDCMPGSRRDAIYRKTEEKRPDVVRKDEWRVRESAAVRGARGEGRGILQVGGRPLGLGVAGRSASGGKRVRFGEVEGRGEEG